MATNAVYKVYNGSAWVEYYFKTSAAQVGVTSARKFLTTSVKVNGYTAGTSGAKVTVDSSGDGANIEVNGAHITGSASAVSGSSLQYITSSDTVAVALGKLDKAAKAAYDNIPAGIITTNNWEASMKSLLGLTNDNYGSWATALAALGGTVGGEGLIGWYDTGYSVYSWETVASSTAALVYGTDIKMAEGSNTTIKGYVDAVKNKVDGMTTSYAISDQVSGTNSLFNSTGNTVTVTGTPSTTKITTTDGTQVAMSSLSIGDSIFITQTDVPDRWLSSITGSGSSTQYVFQKLETYNMAWAAISGKPTTLAGYGITDAKIQNGTITLGSNSITPLTSHQSLTGRVPYTGATADVNLGDHIIRAGSFLSQGMNMNPNSGITFYEGDTTFTSDAELYITALYGGIRLSVGDGQTAQYKNSEIANHDWVLETCTVCQAGTSFSGTAHSGDIWIDTNN